MENKIPYLVNNSEQHHQKFLTCKEDNIKQCMSRYDSFYNSPLQKKHLIWRKLNILYRISQ